MEELLNNLIEKGWKPYGYKVKDMENWTPDQPCKWLERTNMEDGCVNVRSYRDIVSKESGLWQFCVENGMVNGVDRWTLNARQKSIYDKYITSEKEYTPKMNYEYRLIESTLCDEDKLEEFLLNNIKIDE